MATEDFENLTRRSAAPGVASGQSIGDLAEGPAAIGPDPGDPKLDVETLVAIMGSEQVARGDSGRAERLRALRAWREALVRRHELARRPPWTPAPEPAPLAIGFREMRAPSGVAAEAFDAGGEPALDLRGLERASNHAGIDRVLPPFAHRGFLVRGLARLVARGVSFLARFITTRQSLVNSMVIEYLAETARRVNEQEARTSRLAAAARDLAAREREEREEIAACLRELQAAGVALGRGVDRLQRDLQEERGKVLDHELQLAEVECARTWSQVAELDTREELGRLNQLAGRLGGRVREQEARVAGEEARGVGREERLESLVQDLAELQSRLADQEKRVDGQRLTEAAIHDLVARAESMEESLADLAQALEPGDEDEPATTRRAAPPGHVSEPFEGLYVNLENQFRGSRELVSSRLASYLPLLRETGAGAVDHPILDLGCGRGEWLELLAGRGLSARGVESNTVAVSNCRTLGLDVAAADALEYLREQASRSLGMVTAFHLLEHLPFDYAVELLGETLRVLEPGGVALFETPNPENLVVAAKSFHCDPTHRRPLVPELLVFLMQQQGFSKVRVERQTHGRPDDRLPSLADSDPLAARLNPLIELLNRHFAAPSDFAVIGYRST